MPSLPTEHPLLPSVPMASPRRAHQTPSQESSQGLPYSSLGKEKLLIPTNQVITQESGSTKRT